MRLVTQDGRVFELRPGDNTIGRGLENAIILPSLSLSRRHACLRWDNTGVYLMDVGSVNGTFVNGRRLAPGNWLAVQPGISIQLGQEVVCQVSLAPATPPAPGSRAPEASVGRTQVRAVQPGAGPELSALATGRSQAGLGLLLQAVDVSFSKDKLIVALGGSLIAGLALLLLSFLAFRLLGDSLVLGVLFVIVGGALAWLTIALMSGALTKMSHAELTGRQPVSIREAVQYAVRRWSQFALTPLVLLLALLVLGLAEVTVMLIGRIDYVGELLTSLLFLPAFVFNLFLVVALLFGASLVFPIVVDRGRGIAGSLAYLFKLLRTVPARVVLYLGTAGVVTWVVSAVLWGLVSAALLLTTQVLLAGLGGSKFGAIWLSDFGGLVRLIPGLDLFSGLGGLFVEGRATYAIAARLLQLGMVIAAACMLALPAVLQISLACAVYLNVKDDVPA